MYLVTGATGNVGAHIVTGLLAAGADVRATSRNPGTAGLPAGVDVISALPGRQMFTGVHAVFLNPATMHDTAETLLQQAVEAGVNSAGM
ncbi:NAD(P)H-binding protein [Nocardia carnea]|uniref:NAD(P)H-binding protein n=1 Tax=Nocardia carnea TaxID=37328 RepID=UPI0032AF4EC2